MMRTSGFVSVFSKTSTESFTSPQKGHARLPSAVEGISLITASTSGGNPSSVSFGCITHKLCH
jgi:hypothetical protein